MELVVEITQRHGDGPDARDGLAPAEGAASSAEAVPADVIPEGEIPGATDDTLVRAAVAGQREAFGELLARYVSLLFWFIGGRVKGGGGEGEVEEVAQESLVRAYEGLARLRVPRAFSNWLLTIADNVLRERARRESKIISLDLSGDQLEATSRGPAEALSHEEFRARMNDEMQRLPVHYRTVLALKYMNGYPVDEIARRLQIPEGTVRGRLSRAYAILRGRLGPLAPWSRGPRPADDAASATD